MGLMARRLSLSGWPLALLLGCGPERQTEPVHEPGSPALAGPEGPAPIEAEVDPSSAPPAEPTPEESRPTSSLVGVEGSSFGPVAPIERTPGETGALDRDVIRRIVRANLNEVRDCYNEGLAKDPTLTGRIMIDFTIGPTGAVKKANATDVTGLTDPALPVCITDAILTWTFPKPRGGANVNVSYPFNLVPN